MSGWSAWQTASLARRNDHQAAVHWEIGGGMDRVIDEACTAIARLRPWSRGGERAPHKPLLLLLAFERTRAGRPRLVAFTEIETPLRDLIATFGPTRARYHPEYPFWRLQADGLWEVEDAAAFGSRASNTDPPITELRSRGARGGLPAPLDRALRSDAAALQRVSDLTLSLHFEEDVDAVRRALSSLAT